MTEGEYPLAPLDVQLDIFRGEYRKPMPMAQVFQAHGRRTALTAMGPCVDCGAQCYQDKDGRCGKHAEARTFAGEY